MLDFATRTSEDRLLLPGTAHPAEGPFAPVDEAAWERARYPLGAHLAGRSATFAVRSGRATRILLEVYGEKMGQAARQDYWMARGADGVWRAKVAGIPKGCLYGFRAWGPNWPFTGEWRRGNSAEG